MAYTYKDYEDNERIKDLQKRVQETETKTPQQVESKWAKNADDALEQYKNREKFKYNLNGDALYQQYKQTYMDQGKQLMKDAMGQASALTGGYGNSYANTVGNQAYQNHMNKLNTDVIPQLYELAYDQYKSEGNDLLNLYGIYADKEKQDYDRYRDAVSDNFTERQYLADMLNNERSFTYGQYADKLGFDYGAYRDNIADQQRNEEFAYKKEQDAIDNAYRDKDFNEDVRQFNEEVRQFNEKMAYQKYIDSLGNDVEGEEDPERETETQTVDTGTQSTGGSTTHNSSSGRSHGGSYTGRSGTFGEAEATKTERTNSFVNGLMTSGEFSQNGSAVVDGVTVTSYDQYIAGMIVSALKKGELKDGEAKYLYEYYNIG